MVRRKIEGALALVSFLAFLLLLTTSACTRDRSPAFKFVMDECPEGTVLHREAFDDGSRRQWCEFPADNGYGVRHGPFTAWHPNGQIASLTFFERGYENGPFTLWFENGQKSQDGEFKDGRPHGRWYSWLDDGTPVYIMDFRDGEVVCGEDPLQPSCP